MKPLKVTMNIICEAVLNNQHFTATLWSTEALWNKLFYYLLHLVLHNIFILIKKSEKAALGLIIKSVMLNYMQQQNIV